MSDFIGADRVYITCGYTDLRLGIDGLAALAKRQFALAPFENCLFLFCGRKRDRIKAEYEELRAQSKHVSELECHVERLMETLSLAQHKHFCVSSEKVGICSAGN